MQRWDRHGIDISIPTWRKWKKYTRSSQASLRCSRTNFIRFQGLGIILCVSVLCPPMEALGNIQSALISEQSVSSLWHLSSLTDFPPFILSVSSSPNRQCFCQYNILKNLVDVPWISQIFMPLDIRILHRSFYITLSLFLAAAEMVEQIHCSYT